MIRSTVVNNKEILTEWLPPVLHPERVARYQILRADENVNFTVIGMVNASVTSFIDTDVDVNAKEYYYRIDVINDCELKGLLSDEGSSVYLEGKKEEMKTELNWTPYRKWQPGVENYSIERQRPDGTWETIKVVDGNITDVLIDE